MNATLTHHLKGLFKLHISLVDIANVFFIEADVILLTDNLFMEIDKK